MKCRKFSSAIPEPGEDLFAESQKQLVSYTGVGCLRPDKDLMDEVREGSGSRF